MLQLLVRTHVYKIVMMPCFCLLLSTRLHYTTIFSFYSYVFVSMVLHLITNCTVMPDDGKLDTESDSGEFWVLFGGFAPIGKKVASEDDVIPEATPAKLYGYFPLPLFY